MPLLRSCSPQTDVLSVPYAGSRLFALAPYTVAAGMALIGGSSNVQPDFEACAASCVANPNCSVVNWCSQVSMLLVTYIHPPSFSQYAP
jgi:hypothetical protein